MSALSASGTSAESIGLTAPSSPGTYYYGVCVDAVTGESDTSNNCSSAVTVTIRAPDLVVESPSVSDNSPIAGASFTLSATVRNQGDGSSAATTLRYYRSTDATISGTDTQVDTDAVSALAASATSAESIGLTAPASVGTYYYGACVDAVTGESDTSNNCSSAVTVTIRAPDLVVESPIGERPQPDRRRVLHLERHRTQPGRRFVGRDNAALLPLDRCYDLGHRHAGGHGRGERPVGIRNQR